MLIDQTPKEPWVNELVELSKQNGGEVTPEQVVERAKDENSALHSQFTWDDSVAATQWRIEQARGLIRRVRVKFINRNEDEVSGPRFVNVKVADDKRVYAPIERVMNDDALKHQLREAARRDIRAFKARYGILRELEEVFTAMEVYINTQLPEEVETEIPLG